MKKDLKGFRVEHFDNETGTLIPEGSIFMGLTTDKFSLGGGNKTVSYSNWAVPLSAYNITKKRKQENKVKRIIYIFDLKPIL